MEISFKQGERSFGIDWQRQGEDFLLQMLEKKFSGKILKWQAPHFVLQIEQELVSGYFYRGQDFVDVYLPLGTYRLSYVKPLHSRGRESQEPGDLVAPMPGKILKILVQVDQVVKKGESLLILEAMKMEHPIKSPLAGKVIKIFFKQGERVSEGQELILLGEE